MAKLTDDGETQVCSALVVVICIIKIFFKGQITQTLNLLNKNTLRNKFFDIFSTCVLNKSSKEFHSKKITLLPEMAMEATEIHKSANL